MLNVQLKRKRTFAQSVLFVVFLLSSTLAFAQNKVTGTVTDKSGEPLAGVNVLEKGTTNGCITDLDGIIKAGEEVFRSMQIDHRQQRRSFHGVRLG